MIKKWQEFNEALKRGTKIQAKIDLLKELSLELTDVGLEVEIWSGSWKDERTTSINISAYKESKFIIMSIRDPNDTLDYSDDDDQLFHKKEILDFEETLKSFKMTPRMKMGNGITGILFYFDKQGTMSSGGNVLKNYL